MDSGAKSHMVNLEENMTNLKYSEIWVTIGDSRTLIRTKCGDWNSYQSHDGKLHHVTLSNTYVLPGLHANQFGIIWSLKKGFGVTSEFGNLIKIHPRFDLTIKWPTTAAKDLFWPPSSTRAQTTPLFWNPIDVEV